MKMRDKVVALKGKEVMVYQSSGGIAIQVKQTQGDKITEVGEDYFEVAEGNRAFMPTIYAINSVAKIELLDE